MPKGERTKELSFRLWKEGKLLREIQPKISGESKTLRESVKQWITAKASIICLTTSDCCLTTDGKD
jgi:hypothetical protein